MTRLWLTQTLAIVRLEMRKTFFSRRGLWVYLLAFAPLLLFTARAVMAPRHREELQRMAREHPVSSEALQAIQPGMTLDQVTQKLGQPYHQWQGHDPDSPEGRSAWANLRYTDGKTDVRLVFRNGSLVRIHRDDVGFSPPMQQIFAGVFHSYFLRGAIFFGCMGIFVNLFRGEMLDKSLHFYLLTPLRREVLLAGKYAAGLLATLTIFTTSTALQWLVLFWKSNPGGATGPAWGEFASYVAVTALACVGYGSIFLAIGLLFRNPIIPTAVVLVWEGVNPFLPAALKKTSMIYYLQSLCPVPTVLDQDAPAVIRLLISPVQPATPLTAVIGIMALTCVVLLVAARLARRMEINYSTD